METPAGSLSKTGQAGSVALFFRRAAAYLVDIILAFVVLAPLGFLVERLFDLNPSSGPEVWLATALNFSLPVWIYFTLSDCRWGGATVGKRLLHLRVVRQGSGSPPGFARALLRTAVKLLPWELVHYSAFGLSPNLAGFTPLQSAGLILANVLIIAYVILALVTGGRRSAHDYAAGTQVISSAGSAIP